MCEPFPVTPDVFIKMPIYQIRCSACCHEDQIFRTVAERNNLPACRQCDAVVDRVITKPFISTDITPYVSPATGKVINSRTQMRYDLEASGSIMNEPGLKQDVARNKEYQAEKTFAPLSKAIDEKVRQLVNSNQIES